MKYRPEIDGLRAVAVIPVILFHAGFEAFSGGFVGVDVFFVISGYLITSIIMEEIQKGRFSIATFYERRARRILPALLVVVVACFPLSVAWFSTEDFMRFTSSVIAVATFCSNILFWKESGYFDTAVELKPLLHTWSLGVEEQYYLVFPLLLAGAYRFARRHLLAVMVFACLAGLALAEYGVEHHPSATFYLLPTRGWELLLGSIVSLSLNRHRRASAGSEGAAAGVALAGAVTGLALVGVAIARFDSATPFPGLTAVVPAGGTALIIWSASSRNVVGRALSAAPVVRIGLMSYSAYLWHQPIFAFARYRATEPLSGELKAALIGLVLVLAYFSWRVVETPFRDRRRFSRNEVFGAAALGSLVIVAAGVIGSYQAREAWRERLGDTTEYEGARDVMLLGDSHARHLGAGLKRRLGDRIEDRTSPGCIPFFDVDRYDARFEPGACARSMNKALAEFESDDRYRVLVMSSMAPVYLDGELFRGQDSARIKGQAVVSLERPDEKDRWKVYETGMRKTFERLSRLERKSVVFVIDVPELGVEPRKCAIVNTVDVLGTSFEAGSNDPARCRVPRREFDRRTGRFHALVRRVAMDFPRIDVFDPTRLFCSSTSCAGSRNGYSLYRDVDHLSEYGSAYVAGHLEPLVREELDRSQAEPSP